MTFEELCKAEHTITRCVNAVLGFADRDTRKELHNALNIIANVRHAGMFLCDNPSTEVEKLVTDRLISFIKEQEFV